MLSLQWSESIKLGIEHLDDLCTLVADERLGLLVPQGRCSTSTIVRRIGFGVQLPQCREAVQRLLYSSVGDGVVGPILAALMRQSIPPTWTMSCSKLLRLLVG